MQADDLFAKIDATRGGELGRYQEVAHGYFVFPKLEGEIGPVMRFRGKPVLNWSLENYLGLANDNAVRLADSGAAQQWGLGYPMGTRIVSGQTSLHEQLEEQLASMLGREDAVIVNFGYQAVLSAIDTLCGRDDVIVYDERDNAAIVDGLLLHRAKGGKSFVYTHRDADNCRRKIEMAEQYIEREGRGGGILVVTDGVFEVGGDVAPLSEIAALKGEHRFSLFVDDAHGFGVLGANGRGTPEAHAVESQVDLLFGSFAKTMAGIGGFIAGSEKVVNYLRYNMRSQIFDESLPLAMVVGLSKRLDILEREPERRERLWQVTRALQNGLRQAGFDLGDTASAITPVYVRPKRAPQETPATDQAQTTALTDDERAINAAIAMVMDMRERLGIFCSMVKYPLVDPGTIMLRFMPTANHTLDDVRQTVEALIELRGRLDAGAYDNLGLLK